MQLVRLNIQHHHHQFPLYFNLEWCDNIKLSNLLLPRKSGTVKQASGVYDEHSLPERECSSYMSENVHIRRTFSPCAELLGGAQHNLFSEQQVMDRHVMNIPRSLPELNRLAQAPPPRRLPESQDDNMALTVLYLALTVLYLALNVLYLALTFLYLDLAVLYLALTVLYVQAPPPRRERCSWARPCLSYIWH